MARFKAKPVVIDAIRYTGNNFASVVQWARKLNAIDHDRLVHVKTGIEMVTLEGVLVAPPGYWIICGTVRELYPIEPGIFERKYVFDSPVINCFRCRRTVRMSHQIPGNAKSGEPLLRWDVEEVEGSGYRCRKECTQ